MYDMKTKGLGFAQAVQIQPGDRVVVGGVIRRVLEVSNSLEGIQDGVVSMLMDPKLPVDFNGCAPYFHLDGIGWVSWQQCSVYAGRTVKQLAQEVLDIQSGCNPLGLSRGYARALQELRWALEVEGERNDTDAIRCHAINRLWLDKLCDLANYQRGVCGAEGMAEFVAVYDEVSRLAKVVTTRHTGGEHDMGGEG